MTQVFCLRGAWYLMLDSVLVRADFNSKGAAEAAIPVERARRAKKEARAVMALYREVVSEVVR